MKVTGNSSSNFSVHNVVLLEHIPFVEILSIAACSARAVCDDWNRDPLTCKT